MKGILKVLFSINDDGSALFFETLSPRYLSLMKRKNILRHGKRAVEQKGFRGSPITRVELFRKIGMIPTGLRIYNQIHKSLQLPSKPPARNRIIENELNELEELMVDLGIIAHGYVKVDPDLIFIDRGILFENAIVISVHMPQEKIELAPSFKTMQMIESTYAQTGEYVNKITNFLRRKGFGAHAGPGLGGMTNYPLLAKNANMGELGRHGLLITPQSGPCHRLAVVYTNIENLPQTKADMHRWITDFCKTCGLCVRSCPGNAIHENAQQKEENNVSFIDYSRCMSCFNENFGCSVCIKNCPFTKVGYKKIHDKFIKNRKKVAKYNMADKTGFDINRVYWEKGKFEPWYLNETPMDLNESCLNPDEELIIVELQGKKVAFLLREVVYHHIIQGQINNENFILTFCGVCNAGVLLSPLVDGRIHHFREIGVYNGQQIFEDIETHSLWNHLTGEALHGEHQGKTLSYIGSLVMSTVKESRIQFPELSVYVSGRKKLYRTLMRFVIKFILGENNKNWLPPHFTKTLPQVDDRLPKMTMGLAIRINRSIRFYPLEIIRDHEITDMLDGSIIKVTMGDSVPVATLENKERPFQLFTRWYAFILTYPSGELYNS